ncbi:CPBP family intramembrane metalloprotease [Litorilinea aerophila]|uniref:CPBP family intramembrane metalloprotease n=1 Tax=Litorilinea aerophila TaxID=1204385 RepID=A0A540VKU1_9CHLR|nr:type II CAAX endopeptidase family protein [Litorilinea aerophila]MCC9075038.1 CPBP family intramembrane metalloprotease [Litorilinea aerophila]OUC07174.1 hypothetical protein RY27_16495 [Litorilinea aerophila]
MSELFGLVVTFGPLILILLLANAAEARRQRGEESEGLSILTYLLLIFFLGFGVLAGLLIQVTSLLIASQPGLLQELGLAGSGGTPPIQFDSLGLLGLGIWLPCLVGIVLLLAPVRRLLARILPLDAESPVHAVALSYTMLVVINLMFTLGVGLGNLADLVASQQVSGVQTNTILTLWVQQGLMAAMALVGVGWLTRLGFQEALRRLGVVLPSRRQVAIGVGIGLLMVPVVMALEYLSSLVGMGADPDVEALTEQLLGPLFRSPLGILTLGLSAALGEETIFRGALLPRFGLVLTSIIFALLHSNYGITVSTLIVFLLGLVLGWVRLRHNTTTAMVVHAVYNMTLGLLAYLSSSLLNF